MASLGDMTWRRGDSYTFTLTIKDAATSQPIDITCYSFKFTVNTEKSPVDDTNQKFQVIGVVDPDNAIPETDDEFNNIMVRDIFLGEAERPNLLAWPMIVFDTEPADVDWGDTLTLDVMLDNMSNVAAEAFTVKYYLSADETVGSEDVNLGRSEMTGLDPWQHVMLQGETVTLPSAAPDAAVQGWYILAQADSDIGIITSCGYHRGPACCGICHGDFIHC